MYRESIFYACKLGDQKGVHEVDELFLNMLD